MKLRDYQETTSTEAAHTIQDYGLAYLAWECRTGKSITGLVTAQKYGAKKVLFVTKLKALQTVKNDYRELQKLTTPFEIEVINYESVHKATIEPDFLILDEAHCLGAYPKPCKRAKDLKNICKDLPILFMSGTPTPESYSQLYHQLWVSSYSPFSEYKNFYFWSRDYVSVKQRKVNGHTINDYSFAYKNKIDREVGHLFFDYTQEEAGFKCDINEYDIICPILPETLSMMEKLKKNKVLELSDGEIILADTPAKMLSKLHQLSGGTVITESGNHLIIDKSRAKALKNHFAGQKLAIFYVYKSEYDLLKDIFPNHTDSPEEFQSSPDKTFITQIKRGREGIRLDTADSIIFYSTEYSYLSYEQGKNRIVSKERKDPANVYFCISEEGIEKDILEAVRNKKDFTLSWYKSRNPF